MEGDGLVADNLMGKIFDSVSLLMVVMFKEVCPSPPSLPVGTHCFFLCAQTIQCLFLFCKYHIL